jgi:DNA ligase-1
MMQEKVFDTLYGYDKKNKLKEWNIKVENNDTHSVIITSYGQLNGKKTEAKVAVRNGKNIGKKNETTHYEQAILDAQSKWTKKRDIEKYSTTMDVDFSKLNIEEKEEYLPMLAQDYTKHGKKIKYPCFVQPKLDGYRMVFNAKTKQCTSRQGKSFDAILSSDVYKKELASIQEDVVFDGEVYLHGGTFEHLGVLRKKKLKEEDIEKINQLEYHIYDIIDTNLEYYARRKKLNEILKRHRFEKVVLVETVEANTEEEVSKFHEKFVHSGYEGAIVRNANGMYKCKFRSYDLQKYKDFMDDEYKIVDYTYEVDTTGEETNLVVWVCENSNGQRFNVRPQGTREERQDLYKRGLQYIGKKIWVKYFELTDKGVPRFPSTARNTVSEYIRDVVM